MTRWGPQSACHAANLGGLSEAHFWRLAAGVSAAHLGWLQHAVISGLYGSLAEPGALPPAKPSGAPFMALQALGTLSGTSNVLQNAR